MSSPPVLSRDVLVTAFDPDELVTVAESRLAALSDPDAREVLRTLGFPVGPNPWFDMDHRIRERFERVGDWDWQLTDRYDDVPPGADEWIVLGMIPYDAIAFAPDTGRVYCLPQDSGIHLLNSGLRQFVHFLYLLQTERPHFDLEEDDDEDDDAWELDSSYDPEGARSRTEEAMRSVDPAALENPESRWFDVLTSIVDPNAHYL